MLRLCAFAALGFVLSYCVYSLVVYVYRLASGLKTGNFTPMYPDIITHRVLSVQVFLLFLVLALAVMLLAW